MTQGARGIWPEVTANWPTWGHPGPPDRDVIAAYCEAVALLRRAAAEAAAAPLVQTGARGVIMSPTVRVLREATASVRLLAAELGLTRLARGHPPHGAATTSGRR